MSFEQALSFTLSKEGGYVNDPDDPGGETNKGITVAVYNQYRRNHGEPLQSVHGITDEEISDIYKSEYWDKADCDLLSHGLEIAHFDTAVNCGISGANEILQKCIGVRTDGMIGPATKAKLAAVRHDLLIPVYLANRKYHYQAIVEEKPIMVKYLQGWVNRVNDLQIYIAGIEQD